MRFHLREQGLRKPSLEERKPQTLGATPFTLSSRGKDLLRPRRDSGIDGGGSGWGGPVGRGVGDWAFAWTAPTLSVLLGAECPGQEEAGSGPAGAVGLLRNW